MQIKPVMSSNPDEAGVRERNGNNTNRTQSVWRSAQLNLQRTRTDFVLHICYNITVTPT